MVSKLKSIWHPYFLVSFVFVIISALLLWNVIGYRQARHDTLLKAWTELEMQVVRSAARSVQAWLQMRIE